MARRLLHIVLSSHRNPLLLAYLNNDSSASVAYFGQPGSLDAQLKSIGARAMSLGDAHTRLERILALRRYARRGDEYDAWILHGIEVAAAATFARFTSWRSIPSLIVVRHHNLAHHLLRQRRGVISDLIVSRVALHTIAVSDAVRDTLISEGLNPNKISVVKNALDPANFPEKTVQSDLQESQALQLLALGRLVPIKDYETMLRSVAKAQGCGLDVHLTIAGEPTADELRRLRELMRSLDLNSSISILGFVPNPTSLLVQSDALIHTAIDEAFCLSILEALIVGLPVIACSVGGIREVAGRWYRLHPPGDVAAIAAAIADVAENREAYSTYAKTVALQLRPELRVDELSERFLAVVDESLSKLENGWND